LDKMPRLSINCHLKERAMNLRLVIVLVATLLGSAGAYAAGDAAKGTTFATTVCVACHGIDGNGAPAAEGQPVNPRLAGQPAEYIAKQLAEFKSSARINAIMVGMAAILTPEDMANLGAYFAQQKAQSDAAKENGPGSMGEKIFKGGVAANGVPACGSCHGPNGAGIPVQFPRLGGQHAEYTVAQLKAFRSGERANDAAKVMRTIAAKLSDQEIVAVADYIRGLH
jgi:cytochrome c553